VTGLRHRSDPNLALASKLEPKGVRAPWTCQHRTSTTIGANTEQDVLTNSDRQTGVVEAKFKNVTLGTILTNERFRC
jgi:hypothetical protein